MQSKKGQLGDMRQGDSGIAPLAAPSSAPTAANSTLKAIVRDALLGILADSDASAAAKASAGRTLMQYFADDNATAKRRGADMTADELDQAIELFVNR
jgi:hypothetical protein